MRSLGVRKRTINERERLETRSEREKLEVAIKIFLFIYFPRRLCASESVCVGAHMCVCVCACAKKCVCERASVKFQPALIGQISQPHGPHPDTENIESRRTRKHKSPSRRNAQ